MAFQPGPGTHVHKIQNIFQHQDGVKSDSKVNVGPYRQNQGPVGLSERKLTKLTVRKG